MTELRTWVEALVPSVNLLLLLFGLTRIFSRHEAEWRDKERRLATVENEVAQLKTVVVELAGIRTKVIDLIERFDRVQKRVESFLDTRKEV